MRLDWVVQVFLDAELLETLVGRKGGNDRSESERGLTVLQRLHDELLVQPVGYGPSNPNIAGPRFRGVAELRDEITGAFGDRNHRAAGGTPGLADDRERASIELRAGRQHVELTG